MSYNAFADFYDILTENVDYKVRSDYISNFFSRYGNGGKRLLDLACGTGTFSSIFAEKGFDVTGVDLSEEMLTIADNKYQGKVKLVKGNMCSFQFTKKYDYCLCSLDSINHITDYEDVVKCFDCVYNSLNSKGLFVFDVNTVYKHSEILADNAFVYDYEDFFLSWDNEYLDNNIVRILIDIFAYNGKSYDRYSEEFCERAYSIDELKNALNKFEIIGIYDELTESNPKADSERIYFICKKV